MECSDEICEGYNSCSTCTVDANCGWCQNGYYCLAGSDTDNGSCNSDFYYHIDSETNYECPESSGDSSSETIYITSVESDPESERNSNLKEKLDDYKLKVAIKEAKISKLQDDKSEIINQGEEAIDIETGGIYVDDNLDQLSEKVDQLALNEEQEMKDYQKALSEAATEIVIEETDKIISNRNDEILKEIEESNDAILQEIEDVDESLSREIRNVTEAIDDLGDSLDESNELVEELEEESETADGSSTESSDEAQLTDAVEEELIETESVEDASDRKSVV